MVKFKKILFVKLVLLLVLAVIVGCSSESGSSEEGQSNNNEDTPESTDSSNGGTPKQGGEATVTFLADVSSFDPIISSTGSDQSLLWPIYETLIAFTPDLKLKPGLVESWEIPDDKTIILHLKEGVTFHDGTEFNAEAVKFNLDRAVSDESTLSEFENLDSVDVTDPRTVKLNLKQPDASILSALSDRGGMMVSPTAVEEYGKDYAQHPVGAGPFKMVKRVPNGEIVFEAFEDYWQEGKPYLDKLTVKVMAEENARINALKSGEVDYAYGITSSNIKSFEGDSNIVLTEIMPLRFNQLFINVSMAPLDNKNVRLAILHGINREALIQALEFGKAEQANQPFPKGYWAYDESMEIEYDPEKSKQLLEESGLENISFTLIHRTDAYYSRFAEAIRSQLAEIGIEVELQGMELVAADASYFAEHKAQAYLTAYTGRADPHQSFQILYSEDSFFNTGSYSTPEIESLMSEAVSIFEQEKRAPIYKELSRKAILEEAISIPIYFSPRVSAMNNKLKGYEPNLLGKPFFNNLWIEE